MVHSARQPNILLILTDQHRLSVMPLVRGEKTDWRDSIVIEFHGLIDTPYTMRTIRHGQYKYGYSFASSDELYDLDEDPYEMTNLIDVPAYAGVLHDMRMRLWQWINETGDTAAYCYRHSVLGEYDIAF